MSFLGTYIMHFLFLFPYNHTRRAVSLDVHKLHKRAQAIRRIKKMFISSLKQFFRTGFVCLFFFSSHIILYDE